MVELFETEGGDFNIAKYGEKNKQDKTRQVEWGC